MSAREFKDLDSASADQKVKQQQQPWNDIMMERKYRPHLCMVILIPFFQQMTGINFFMFFSPVLFKTLGADNNTSLKYTMIIGLVYICATLVATVVADELERRFEFLKGGFFVLILQVLVARVKYGFETNPKMDYIVPIVLVICCHVIIVETSWGPIGWLFLSEIFPVEIRSAAQSITVSVNMLFTSIVAEVSLNLLCDLKLFGLFYFFAGFVVVGTIFFYYFMPETKGKSVEEMSHVWKQHWYWGRYYIQEEEEEPEEETGGGNIQTEMSQQPWLITDEEWVLISN
ncbi:Sugar/inositol transporter [Macleaya cordata]|uniref:Sugar/inositol transporter n=1 Tax=Macleaya cordata TaxID=56857 RepID=A0A200PXU7_MACCD|nr:Sugar/inositol transporter [Macleaya cordata]